MLAVLDNTERERLPYRQLYAEMPAHMSAAASAHGHGTSARALQDSATPAGRKA
jgi:hypothetical protein